MCQPISGQDPLAGSTKSDMISNNEIVINSEGFQPSLLLAPAVPFI